MSTRCKPIDYGFRKATAEADGNNLIISIAGFCPADIIQGDKLSFAITECFDYPQTKINNVKINVNGTDFIAIKIGNVKWDVIKSRVCYTGIFGTEEPSFTILNNLPCSKFDYPTYATNSSTFEKVTG